MDMEKRDPVEGQGELSVVLVVDNCYRVVSLWALSPAIDKTRAPTQTAAPKGGIR